MRKFLLYIISSLFILSVCSQGLPCSKPVYRQFDFWVGNWEAYGVKGGKAGDSKISVIIDSCIILEEWTSAGLQQGLRYAGKSFNTYNAGEKQWQQTWVDNTGNTTFFSEGRYEDNPQEAGPKIIFKTRPFKISKDSFATRKLTFFNLDKNKVRQLGEISKDNEATWVTEYDLEYRRKENFAMAVADSLFKKMEDAYNSGNFEKIAACYAGNGKMVSKQEEVSGNADIINYWKGFASLGGTWKLTNLKAEQTGNQIWQKGTSVITDKNNRQHKVDFTLILIRENNEWKILQDAWW